MTESEGKLLPNDVRLQQALYEAECYGIGATSNTNQKVILEAAIAFSRTPAQPASGGVILGACDDLHDAAYKNGWNDGFAAASSSPASEAGREPVGWLDPSGNFSVPSSMTKEQFLAFFPKVPIGTSVIALYASPPHPANQVDHVATLHEEQQP